MTAKDYRRIALSLPGVSEGSHQGHPDFRFGGKIFCTLAFEKEGYGVLKLSQEEQAGLGEDAPEVFLLSLEGGGAGSHPRAAGQGERGCA